MSRAPQPDRPNVPPPVEFYRHGLGAAEARALRRVLNTLFLTTGPETAAFEREFAAHLGVAEAVGTSSCTMALTLALRAVGVERGEEVVVTPLTYVATVNAILHAGGTPVFADVEAETGLLDPAAAEAAITPRTRALLPVHLWGAMADMRACAALAQKHGIALIEDAAHCVEGSRDGLRPGALSDAACFSFYATKNLACGEGGAVATRDAALAARLRRLRNHGIDRAPGERHGTDVFVHWDQMELGFKGNLSDLQAALLRPQLPRLAERLAAREALAQRYDAALRSLPGLRLPATPAGAVHARHLHPIIVDPARRGVIAAGLKARGIGVAINYRPVHLLTYYRERFGLRAGQFPRAEALGEGEISLPLYPGLKRREQDRVVATLRELLSEKRP